MKLILPGHPKSTNHIYKMTCRGKFASMYMSKEGKDLKESYRLFARISKIGLLQGFIGVKVTLYHGTKRKADIDNFNKLWMDALSGIIYEDDKQIQEMFIRNDYDKQNPRIELEFYNL